MFTQCLAHREPLTPDPIVAMSNDGQPASPCSNQTMSSVEPNCPKSEPTLDSTRSKCALSGSPTSTASDIQQQQPQASDECSLSIVYGNEAQYVGDASHIPELPEGHTHRWAVYVRAYNDHEAGALAKIVRKVVFVLEPHYRNECVDSPPFTVTRTGWGEFAVKIRLYFHDVLAVKPLVLSHDLRLVAYHKPERSGRQQSSDDWSYVPFVREESYDEVVIFRPTPRQRALFGDGVGDPATKTNNGTTQEGPGGDCKPSQHEVARAKALQTILHAKKVIAARLADVKDRLIANQGCTDGTALQGISFVNVKSGETPKKRAGRPKKGIERIQEHDGRQLLEADMSKANAEYYNHVDAANEYKFCSENFETIRELELSGDSAHCAKRSRVAEMEPMLDNDHAYQ